MGIALSLVEFADCSPRRADGTRDASTPCGPRLPDDCFLARTGI